MTKKKEIIEWNFSLIKLSSWCSSGVFVFFENDEIEKVRRDFEAVVRKEMKLVILIIQKHINKHILNVHNYAIGMRDLTRHEITHKSIRYTMSMIQQ